MAKNSPITFYAGWIEFEKMIKRLTWKANAGEVKIQSRILNFKIQSHRIGRIKKLLVSGYFFYGQKGHRKAL